MTTVVSSAAGGTAPPLALTTPFIQQADCLSILDVTKADLSLDGSSNTVTALVSDAADPRFAACQPSGWADRPSQSRFSFSPAVCPSAWTYYALSETVQITQGTASTYSTAYCCASGFTPQVSLRSFGISSIDAACLSTLSAGQPPITGRLNHGSDSALTTVVTQAVVVHQAWHVSWASSDTSTLSPSLPALTSSKYLASWVPGQTVAPGEGDRSGESNDQGWSSVTKFIMIGIPIIGVAILASVAFCIWRYKKKKRERSWLSTNQEASGIVTK